jgi:hypothetical protein
MRSASASAPSPGGAEGLDRPGELARDDQCLGLRVMDNRRHLAAGEARVHRHDDRAELQHAEVHDRVLDAVRRQHGHAVAAPDAQPGERVGELVRAQMERAIGHAVRTDHVGRPLAAHRGLPAEDVSQHQHRPT